MKDFTAYLRETEEIGFVEQVSESIIHASGLPKVKPEEIVVFETGEFGQVFSITPEFVEILIFSKSSIKPGTRVARTNEILKVPVGYELLGRIIDPLGKPIDSIKPLTAPPETSPIIIPAAGIVKRRSVT